jgi:hypothetical protein
VFFHNSLNSPLINEDKEQFTRYKARFIDGTGRVISVLVMPLYCTLYMKKLLI